MQNQQFISEEERAAYAKIEAPILRPRALGYRRLDIMDNDRGSAPNPVMPHGDTAGSSPNSMMPSGDAAGSSPNPEMPSGDSGAAAPGRCSRNARP